MQVSGSTTPDFGSWKVINAHFTYREIEAFEKTLSLATVHATDEGQYENSKAAVFSLGHRVLPHSPLLPPTAGPTFQVHISQCFPPPLPELHSFPCIHQSLSDSLHASLPLPPLPPSTSPFHGSAPQHRNMFKSHHPRIRHFILSSSFLVISLPPLFLITACFFHFLPSSYFITTYTLAFLFNTSLKLLSHGMSLIS